MKRPGKLSDIAAMFRKASGISMTMRIRLYAFLLVVVVLMLLAIVIIFSVTGQLTAAHTAAERFAENEFARIHRDLTLQIGDITVELVSLSQSISRSVEHQLLSREIPVSELDRHPEILEELIAGELIRMQQSMEKTGSTGVFMVLDATVNPTLVDSGYSRAGFYLRDYEPRAVGTPDITWFCVRGFPSIAYQNDIDLLKTWEMEFDVRDADFFTVPKEMSRETSLPLSRMYYWSNEGIVPELDVAGLICSIPLLDSEGVAFGVCGFEISNWNFRFRYAPTDGEHRDTLSMFGPIIGDNTLLRENVLFSGVQRFPTDNTPLILISGNGLGRYRAESGREYLGVHGDVKMYPANSPFADERFALSLLIPKETIDAAVRDTNRTLTIILLTIMMLGIGVSIFIGNRYLKPITSAFAAMRSGEHASLQTNIKEIDELLSRIKEMRSKDNPIPDDLFEDFINRVGTLTPTEMTIFRHYYDGVGINELPSIMHISMNTLKSHNRHIYSKLGISSKDELVLYIELIEKSGQKDKII